MMREVSLAALNVGDVVVIEDRLPSSEGFRHVVDDVRELWWMRLSVPGGTGCTTWRA